MPDLESGASKHGPAIVSGALRWLDQVRQAVGRTPDSRIYRRRGADAAGWQVGLCVVAVGAAKNMVNSQAQ